MTSQPTKSRFHEPVETEVIRYQAVEPMAVISLIFGLLSIVAVFDIVGCFFVAPTIIFGLLSLTRIKHRSEAFIGRKAALFGIVFALLFCSTGVARRVTAEYLIRQQASTIGREFLELIANDQPELAFQWTLTPNQRCHSNKEIWAFYNADAQMAERLRKFTSKEGVRALLAIGHDAKIYPVGRPIYTFTTGSESINHVYAIDFKSEGKAKTFFFAVLLRRTLTDKSVHTWRVVDYVGGVDPWEKKEKKAGRPSLPSP